MRFHSQQFSSLRSLQCGNGSPFDAMAKSSKNRVNPKLAQILSLPFFSLKMS